MIRVAHLMILSAAFVITLGGCKKATCKEGKLDPAWTAPHLAPLVPKEATICEVPAAEAATHATFWRPVRVHRANMDSVDGAQDNGWTRTGDNWYSSTGDYDSPKWSEFKGPEGALRVDVKEDGGGARIDVKFTPKN